MDQIESVLELVQIGDTGECRSPKSCGLFVYWQLLAASREMPARQDIDPLDIPGLLGDLLLVDCLTGSDFRFRLVGTRVVDLIGREFTGKYLMEADVCRSSVELQQSLQSVVRLRRPMALRGHCAFPKRQHAAFEILLLPLSSDGTTVDIILAGLFLLEGQA